MNLRLMKPRLRPAGSTALVITRPWYWAETATRPPPGDSNTCTGPCFVRNATSSANVVKVGIAGSLSGDATGLAALGVELHARATRSGHDVHQLRSTNCMALPSDFFICEREDTPMRARFEIGSKHR